MQRIPTWKSASRTETRAFALIAALGIAFLPVFWGRRPTEAVASGDRRTEESVGRAFTEHDVRSRDRIDVRAFDGAVRLSGRVRTERDRFALLLAAGSAAGVRILVDDLRVDGKE